MAAVNQRRIKTRIKEMMPVKKRLSLNEACSYMDMSVNHFQNLAKENGLTLSVLGAKKYYMVAELENLFEENIIIKKVS